MSSALELELSLISFAGSDSTFAVSSKSTTMGIPSGWGGGDYFKRIRQREAIIWGRLLNEGRLLFEEIL